MKHLRKNKRGEPIDSRILWIIIAFILLFMVVLALLANSAAAYTLVNLSCDNPVKLPNSSIGCVNCDLGSTFSNTTGGCVYAKTQHSYTSNAFVAKLGFLTPENPTLSFWIIVTISGFAVYRILKEFR